MNKIFKDVPAEVRITDRPEGLFSIRQNDTAALAGIFSRVLCSSFVRLRLDVVTTNACQNYHNDTVRASLICTYRWMGTQYSVTNNAGIPCSIFTVPTGAPILVRGKPWPEIPTFGFRHHSPSVERSAETRLVFVLEPVDEPQPEPEQDTLPFTQMNYGVIS